LIFLSSFVLALLSFVCALQTRIALLNEFTGIHHEIIL